MPEVIFDAHCIHPLCDLDHTQLPADGYFAESLAWITFLLANFFLAARAFATSDLTWAIVVLVYVTFAIPTVSSL
jgi:hypothetical protein